MANWRCGTTRASPKARSEVEPLASDDDRARDDRRDRRHRDDKRDTRADSRRQQRDDELDLYEAQGQWNECYMAIDGKKAPTPVSGHSARTYRLYCAQPYQKYSTDWKAVDLAKLAKTDPAAFTVAETQIRADSIRIGNNPQELQKFKSDGYLQREIRRQDRTGRWISEFVGPVDAPNGMFKPFELPPLRLRGFNKNPNRDY
jgi:hypothetical protein